MSAYAALVSLGHIIKQIQHHPRPPISLHELQVESLTEKVTFLQDFLEKNSINGGSEESEALESRIADAAHAAEDMIESLIVDHILAGSTITHHGRQISGSPDFDQGSGSPEFYQGSGSSEFYRGLQKVIEDMDFIKKDAMEIKAKMGDQDEPQHEYSTFAGSSRSPSMVKSIMVGLDDVLIDEGWSRYRLNNLESLGCYFNHYSKKTLNEFLQNLTFPHSLKELTLYGGSLSWEFITTEIGSLPFLEILKLKFNFFKESKWETVDDRFQNLKYLQIRSCRELEYWNTDSTHFPRLEQLVLIDVVMLKEIPSAIGHIQTLQSIRLEFCGKSAVMSAKRILEEQEELGNVDLQVRVNESRQV